MFYLLEEIVRIYNLTHRQSEYALRKLEEIYQLGRKYRIQRFIQDRTMENNVYEEAERALRISTILTYLNIQRISVAGCLEMPLEVLETHLLEVRTIVRVV